MNCKITSDDVIKNFFALQNKTDVTLLADVLSLVSKEKMTQAALIAHLSEIAERKLHLDLGYASMFDYCLRALCLAEGEIWLRLQVSSCCRKFPEIFADLASGLISLTVAGRISALLDNENKMIILEFCRGKSTRAVEEFLASLKPKPVLPSSLRKQGSTTKKQELTLAQQEEMQRLPNEKQLFPVDTPSPSRIEALGEERYHVRFAFTAAQRRKMERLAELLGVDNPAKNLAELMEKALDLALKAKDPARIRRAKKSSAPAESKHEKLQVRSRNIPANIRREVFSRGGYQCQFLAKDGARCPQRRHLCIDHVVPFAQGGGNELSNLQLLCAGHNLRKAEIDFGFKWQQVGRGKS
jgi:5-methylcytosine-specific restriction endonuclease McrA